MTEHDSQNSDFRAFTTLRRILFVATPAGALACVAGYLARWYSDEAGWILFALFEVAALAIALWLAAQRLDRARRGVPLRPAQARFDQVQTALTREIELARDAAQESVERLRVITDNSPTCIGYLDTGLHYRFCNRTYQLWYGMAPEDLIGRTVADLVGDVAFREIAPFYRRALAGEQVSYERTITIDHQSRTILVELAPGRADDGEVLGLFAWASDVTPQREQQAALRESETRFRQAFDFAAIGMAIVSPDGRWLQVNHALCDLLGYNAASLLNMTFQQVTHPDDLAADTGFVGQMLAGTIESYQMEKRYLHRDGSVVWVLLSVSLVRDAYRTPVHFVAQIQNITPRREAEIQLRRSTSLLRQTEQMARIGGWSMDLPTLTLELSEQVYRIHELAPGSHPNLTAALEFYPPEVRPDIERAIAVARTDGIPWDLELPFVTAGGRRLWVRTQGNADMQDGQAVRLFGTFQDITERKEAQLALERSQRFLDAVIEAIPQPVFVKDEQHRWVLFNTRFATTMMGLPRERLIGHSDPDIYPPDVVAKYWAEDDEALGQADPTLRENPIPLDDGSIRWMLESKQRCELPDGSRYIVGVGTDITHMKQMQEALGASEASHRLLAEHSSDMIQRLTPAGVITYVSAACRRTLGYRPEDLKGSALADFIHPDDLESTAMRFAAVVRNDAQHTITCRLRHRDGHWLWSESSFRAVHAADTDEVLEVIAVTRDIDERFRATATVNRFKYALDNTLDLIVIIDPRTLLHQYVNRGVTDALGYTEAEMLRMTPMQIRPGVSEDQYRGGIAPLLAGLVPSLRYECDLQRRDGSPLPVDVSLQVIQRPDEADVLIAVARDATERKKVERMKNEFVSTVSHELRTPLTSIRGALGLLTGGAAGVLPKRAAHLARIALENSDRLMLLIDDILHIEKMESGNVPFDVRPEPVRQLLAQAIEANAAYGQQFEVRFELAVAIPDCLVALDRNRFMQVMANLLSNAAKYSPPGGVVSVRAVRDDGMVRIEITDQGPGIPPEFRAKMFGKFSQADSSNTRPHGGTGLGLNIVRSIMERHGGDIDYITTTESETPGRSGTTFVVRFPEARLEPARIEALAQ